jgi:hypothetical protein
VLNGVWVLVVADDLLRDALRLLFDVVLANLTLGTPEAARRDRAHRRLDGCPVLAEAARSPLRVAEITQARTTAAVRPPQEHVGERRRFLPRPPPPRRWPARPRRCCIAMLTTLWVGTGCTRRVRLGNLLARPPEARRHRGRRGRRAAARFQRRATLNQSASVAERW